MRVPQPTEPDMLWVIIFFIPGVLFLGVFLINLVDEMFRDGEYEQDSLDEFKRHLEKHKK